MSSLHGSVSYPFSQMVRDTINEHGEAWAWDYYVRKHKLPRWQYRLFAGLGCDNGMQ